LIHLRGDLSTRVVLEAHSNSSSRSAHFNDEEVVAEVGILRDTLQRTLLTFADCKAGRDGGEVDTLGVGERRSTRLTVDPGRNENPSRRANANRAEDSCAMEERLREILVGLGLTREERVADRDRIQIGLTRLKELELNIDGVVIEIRDPASGEELRPSRSKDPPCGGEDQIGSGEIRDDR
jgi:hypothetical protein